MKIGVIGAMDIEIASLVSLLGSHAEKTYAGMVFRKGMIGGTEVIIAKCGVGKVNAAVCAEIMCGFFCVDVLVNTGVAGSLDNSLDIGDIVVSRDAVQHDVDAVNFGYAYGEIPSSGMRYFVADEDIARKCMRALEDMGVAHWLGRIASGDQFVRTRERKAWIRETFAAHCCEMEGASIAQVAVLNKIPFVLVRAISDKADESVSESYDVFEEKAARHCAELIGRIVPMISWRE